MRRLLPGAALLCVADGIEPTQLSCYGTYESKGVTASPVLARRHGAHGAARFACHMAQGQLALVKL